MSTRVSTRVINTYVIEMCCHRNMSPSLCCLKSSLVRWLWLRGGWNKIAVEWQESKDKGKINRVNVKHILGDPSCAMEGVEVIVTLCRCRCSSADAIVSSSSIIVSLKQLCPECMLIQSDAASEVHLKSSTCLPTY